MSSLMHTAAAGLRSAMVRQEVTAHNLANVSTPGFLADLDAAHAVWTGGPGASVRSALGGVDLSSGPASPTGRALDVAMDGAALLAVQTSDGGEAYTRRGDLQRSSSGLLTTHDGRPLVGSDGPITLPEGEVSIRADGRIFARDPAGGETEVARLKLANPSGIALVKDGDGLLRAEGGGVLPDDPDASVRTGFLEGANIDATQALVSMIDAQRGWDQQLRLINTARDLDDAGVSLMRLNS